MKDFSRKVAELEIDVVLLGTNTTALTDLNRHRPGDDVAGRQILRGRCVPLHEPFTLRIKQVSTLATRS